MNGKVYEDYLSMVQRISSEFGNKFKMVDKQDIEQELWVWFLKHPKKTEEWLALPSLKDADKLFAKSLRNAALDFCLKEKSVAEGYSVDDTFWYTKDFIKLLIPAVLSDDWTKLENALSMSGKSTKSLAESGDWMAFASDIKRAFASLEESEQNLVFLFYAEDVDGNALHERVGAESTSAHATMMKANRALGKMVKFLGGKPPFRDNDYTERDKNVSVEQEDQED
jgi:hypothetical protein